MLVEQSRRLFKEWNIHDVCYCHWKSNEHLVQGLDGDTDLDVLLKKSDKEVAEQYLVNCDYSKYKSQYGSRYPDVDDWIGQDVKTGKMIHIHLHYRIITGHKGMKEYDLPWTDFALQTRVLDPKTDVFVMEPNLELITLYTRIGLKASMNQVRKAKRGNFALSRDDVAEILYLKGLVSWQGVEQLLHKYYVQNFRKALEIIKKEKLSADDFIIHSEITAKEFAECDRNGAKNSKAEKYYFAAALRLIGFIKNRLNINIITRKVPYSGKGLVIAFIGQDGAGKSTVSDDILKWLTWKIEAKKFYLGSGEHYKSWRKSVREAIHNHPNIITTFISAYLTISDYKALAKKSYKTIKSARRYADKGGMAIFDRFPQNIYLGINDGPKIRSNYVPKIHNKAVRQWAICFADMEEKYINKCVKFSPDIVFKLLLPPEVSMQRKPEEDFESVMRKHDIIKKLKFDDSDIYEIDATQEYAHEMLMIKEIIWKKMP